MKETKMRWEQLTHDTHYHQAGKDKAFLESIHPEAQRRQNKNNRLTEHECIDVMQHAINVSM